MKPQKFQKELESYRLEVDYLKHLTTLSTAAILVILTMNEKIGASEETKNLLFYSLIGFLITILCSVWINFRLVWTINDDDLAKLPAGPVVILDVIGFIGSLIAFFVAVTMLVIFIYKNAGL